jgi:hypothetical protein
MTSTFDFLMVLYSIIVGVSMGQILTAVGNLIQSNKPVKHYWVHTGWVVFVFCLHIFLWFSAWEYAAIQVWSISGFMTFLTVPVVLFIASVVALPDINPDKLYDMRDYYFKNCRWLHALLLTIILLSSINEYLLLDQSPLTVRNTARGVAALFLFLGLFLVRPKLHAAQISIIYVLMGFFALTYRESIGG